VGDLFHDTLPVMTDEEIMQARIEHLELKYPRTTRVGLKVIDRAARYVSISLTLIGLYTVARWLLF
jgi:hypothetical protein